MTFGPFAATLTLCERIEAPLSEEIEPRFDFSLTSRG